MSHLFVNTRPEGLGEELSFLAQSAGWEVLNLPLLRIDPILPLPKKFFQVASSADIIIFISPSAVSLMAKYVRTSSFSGSLIATGRATAQALIQQGLQGVLFPQDGTGAKAVLRMPFWEYTHTGQVMIIGGEEANPLLEQSLLQRGFNVFKEPYYRRVILTPNIAQMTKILNTPTSVILISSSKVAQFWCQNIVVNQLEQAKKLLYLTIHQQISHILQIWGAENIITSSVDNDKIIESLNYFIGTNYGRAK